jgi:hypothetical protein
MLWHSQPPHNVGVLPNYCLMFALLPSQLSRVLSCLMYVIPVRTRRRLPFRKFLKFPSTISRSSKRAALPISELASLAMPRVSLSLFYPYGSLSTSQLASLDALRLLDSVLSTRAALNTPCGGVRGTFLCSCYLVGVLPCSSACGCPVSKTLLSCFPSTNPASIPDPAPIKLGAVQTSFENCVRT